MNPRKKRFGTKTQIREKVRAKKRERRLAVVAFSVLVLIIAGVSAYYAYTSLDQSQNPAFELKAAIVDHLSLTFPNQTFVQTAKNMLEQAGYTVDYYPGENVTVDFYRSLPRGGYKVVILRVHCGHDPERKEIAFFTSEIYNATSASKHGWDIAYGSLGKASYNNPPSEGEPFYFAIKPLFVKYLMLGRFNETAVIMTGCYGMEYLGMAEAFVDKGAKVYIGWEGKENADHADEATLNLLEHLVLEKQTIGQAVENTIKEVGEDPIYGSLLDFYPHESMEQTIE